MSEKETQKTHPDYIKMLEAFAEIRERIKEKVKEQGRDLTPEQSKKIIASVVNGDKGKPPNNPFLKDGVQLDDMTDSIHEYIQHCRTHKDDKTGLKPHYNLDGFQEFTEQKASSLKKEAKDDGIPPEAKKQAKEMASKNDEISSRVGKAKKQLTGTELYYETIFNILEAKDGTVPDPSKYYWACEQLKHSEELKYQVVETERRQQVSFMVKFRGQPEKVFKSVDFRLQQKDIQPVDTRDLSELNSLSHQLLGDGKSTSVPPVIQKDDKGKPMPVSPKEAASLSENPSSLFKDIKKKLGYDKARDDQQWISLGNKSEVLTQVIYLLRDTKGIPHENIQEKPR